MLQQPSRIEKEDVFHEASFFAVRLSA